ncbi:ATP synthase subunit C lysine N-methyltransferase isoform X1 [Panthera pardus]|uniref:ATP synthase subunit C lysine N-methyltransferase isoform X1 n=1 Tax=Panthera pardus TaxID=9691 RepID=A0A9V1FP26_PANPR|nr:ATP synthase subunit C lysine N-methyltransferase isoform X1 [Panthera pardus]
MEGGGGTPPEILEESQAGCSLPTGLGANGLKKSSWGFFLTGIVGGTLVAVYAVATPFLTPALRKICLPFVPATTKQIANVVKMLHCRRGSLVDIGSGDGRVVIAAAKEGFTAVGYELNPWLVWYSRYRAWREGVQDSAKFYISDLWKVTFSQYTNVVVFGVPQMASRRVQKKYREFQNVYHPPQRAPLWEFRCVRGEQRGGWGPSLHDQSRTHSTYRGLTSRSRDCPPLTQTSLLGDRAAALAGGVGRSN